MTPDYDRAAIKATETLIQFKISAAPVDPLPILRSMPGTMLVSYAAAAESLGIERRALLTLFGAEGQDAATFAQDIGGALRYIVVYNQRLPFYLLQRAFARELGHIVLGHDGSRPIEVRDEEAITFARHLLCPRALVRAIKSSGIPFSIELLGAMTGCYERCLAGLKSTPGAHVPAEMNRSVGALFSEYVTNLIDFQRFFSRSDTSQLIDFGSYMDYYED